MKKGIIYHNLINSIINRNVKYSRFFLLINLKNYNFFSQSLFLEFFCKYFFFWSIKITKFINYFKYMTTGINIKLLWCPQYKKTNLINMCISFFWNLHTYIFRYYKWIILISYRYTSRKKKTRFLKYKRIKKMRELFWIWHNTTNNN